MQIKWTAKTDLEKAGLKVVELLNAGLKTSPSAPLLRGEGGSNLKKNHFQAFWVGGIVRNIIMKRDSDNIDIASDATPDQIEAVLSKAKINHKPVGKQFGSILAFVNKQKIEVTTFRAEGRYSDNRHPDHVDFIKDYLQDAKRRDFTINALYFDPVRKFVYDPAAGIKDLGLKLIKFVGDPRKRIDEDALRMLRGVRLATQLGFKLEKNSFAAIKTRAKYIQDISGERIKAELDKILLSKNRVNGIQLLDEIGLLKFIIPELLLLKGFGHKSRNYHLEGDMFNHTMMALANIKKPNLDLAYAVIFHDIGKPNVAQKKLKDEGWVVSTHGHADVSADIFRGFAKRLKFSRASASLIEQAIRDHMAITHFNDMRPQKQALYALKPNFDFLVELGELDNKGSIRSTENLRTYKPGWKKAERLANKVRLLNPEIQKLSRGEVIMKYSNLKPGKTLGQKIQQIKIQIVLGRIKSETDLKNFLKIP